MSKSILELIPININLAPLPLLPQCLGQHQLAHPINALIPALDRKMMRLPRRRIQDPPFLRRGDELECKRRGVAFFFLAAELERFKGRAELGVGGQRGACDGVFVDVDAFEGVEGFAVAVHGETGAVQAEVAFLPFVPEHFGAALFHPAGVVGVVDVFGGWRQFIRAVDGGQGVAGILLDGRHGEAGLAAARGAGGGALDGGGGLGTADGGEGLRAVAEAGAGAGDGGAAAEAHVWGDGLGLVAGYWSEGDGCKGHIHIGGWAAHSEEIVGSVAVFDFHGRDRGSLLASDCAIGREGVLWCGGRNC